jgi:hypothetical protein
LAALAYVFVMRKRFNLGPVGGVVPTSNQAARSFLPVEGIFSAPTIQENVANRQFSAVGEDNFEL